MVKCLFLFVLFAVAYLSSAAVFNYENTANKDYPNQCYIEGKAYPIGTSTPKGECFKITCSSDFSAVKQTCGAVGPPAGFHNEFDTTKPYPECCVNFVPNKSL
ncbi:uncharacterized protein LOC129564688 [Sitodiplosis mosellana]|uniref:uncharacterized protein LOC129564688 n=1 Tax=Sitodiplosis mosellana TaxID=263140 RepID=UPI002443ABA7|nr:uncharacterized protein LOC129564688 [Sitodiplosis mosellana]